MEEVISFGGKLSPGVTMELMPEGSDNPEEGIFPVECGTAGLTAKEVLEIKQKTKNTIFLEESY